LSSLRQLALSAKQASRRLAQASRAQKDGVLGAVARRLRESRTELERDNAVDLARGREAGLSDAMLDRLKLDVEGTARGVEHVMTLPDPVGSRSAMQRDANGLLIGRQRLPLGVIAMVYESRPNVTIDAGSLCLKSGNAVLLRGGKEARETNRALTDVLRAALVEHDLPEDAVVMIPPGDRREIEELVKLSGIIDLVIPRGGEGLIRFVAETARVPVIQHYKGVCHLFLDAGADAEMSLNLTLNGKVQRPGVCNALECLLVHAESAAELLPTIASALRDNDVEIRGCPRTRELVPWVVAASESDFGEEFLAKILAVRVVPDLDGALEHIQRYGSNHTEAICTPSELAARRFVDEVDASCVLVNASTRFNDGSQLGLGAEIGISTSKLHAYGPMGLESLTTEKWIVLGEGQIRS
jgi:glutamate-5-semialdehyde dehydrogenase